MARVLLINPTYRGRSSNICMPSGLLCVAAVLQAAGHDVEIFDSHVYQYQPEATLRAISGKRFDIVGIGGISTSYYFWKQFLPLFRRQYGRDVPVMAGGSVAATMPETFLRHVDADAICTGDAEPVVAELAERLLHHRPLDSLDGIGYRRGEELVIRPGLRVKDMDAEVPVPPYHLIDLNNYRMTVSRDSTRYGYLKNGGKRLLEFMLFSSRGCPYNCFFCSRNFGRQFIQHSPDNFIAHIEKVTSEYAPDMFYFGDELMTTRREWIVDFCKKYRAAGLEIPFRINARVDTVDEELLAILKEAGCYEVDLGIESGSPEILKEMNKGVNVAQNHQAIRLCQEAGLYASPTMVFGMPSETAATIRETRDFLIAADVRTFGGFFATAYPGSALFEYALSHELITDVDKYMLEVDNAFKLVINYTRLSDDLLRRQVAGVADDVLYAWYKRRGAGSLRLGIMFARRRLRQYLRAAVSILRREGPFALVRRAFREIQGRWANKHTQVEYG